MSDFLTDGAGTDAPVHNADAFPAPDHADQAILTAHRASLLGCRSCGRVWPEDHRTCERCGAALVPPDRRGLQAVWAWLLAGMVFYVPANLLPMMRTSSLGGLGGGGDATIIGGVIQLAGHGDWFIALVVFAASVMVPIGKFIAIIWLALVAGKPATVGAAHTRLHIYEVVEFIGRWSMIDVFVVAILSALVQLGFVVSIKPGPAAVSFALSVAFTMLAAQSFDPRLIWRGLPLHRRKE
ncbi:paraquat-inducible membrane protein A [Paracoccus aurantiacus]|uniref:Paraquat-inducible membrane protein A n=1 Tax=Paracoccus aurantiacus TaxID=2599412 RepID=A0A5C6RZE2_9RHOB|nr:paraquat-inducible protein A [Paracoccus aurantiacus]TXB67768.1 paraquat-inducible membrane protein A [Paracoccus aurantiacus]